MSATRKRRKRRIVIAATGHRPNQLPAPTIGAVTGAVEGALERISQIGQALTGGECRFVLRISLAEGADRIVADAAIRLGWPLEAVLPFGRARYLKDFSRAESVHEFDAMLEESRVTFLDGERLEQEIDENAPYAAAGRTLIEQADLLLCVWNGLPPKGPGGTSEVAALMLEKGGLVLWISPGGAGVRLVGPAPLPRAGSFRRRLHEALAEAYERVARPPEMRVA